MRKLQSYYGSGKGQASIEYMMILSLALLLSTPFIVKAQGAILDLRTSSSVMDVRNSADRIEKAAETVNAAGPPAKREFTIKLPNSVQSSEVSDQAFIYTVRTSNGKTNITRTFDFKIQGDLPDSEGAHILSATAKSDYIEIIEVS